MIKRLHRLRLALQLFIFCGLRLAGAHPALFTSAQIYIQPDGHYQLFTSFDLLAFALQRTSVEIDDPSMYALLNGPPEVLTAKLDQARKFFLDHTKIVTDQGAVSIHDLQFPAMEDINEWRASGMKSGMGSQLALPVVVRVEADGRLPDNATFIRLQFPSCLGAVVLTVNRPGGDVYDEPIYPGTFSSSIPIRLDQTVSDAPVSLDLPLSRSQVWGRYIVMGIQRIIPEGTDHIYFILALFLVSTRFSFLLWQAAAFTIAHSIALALSVYGIFQLPLDIVEPCIAFSVVFIAVENLTITKIGYRRLFVVFAFGLIHGLGFASTLKQTGLPKNNFLNALLGYNLGIELAQLIIIAAAFLAIGWYRRSPHYRKRVIIPGSLLIALIATCWFFHRIYAYYYS